MGEITTVVKNRNNVTSGQYSAFPHGIENIEALLADKEKVTKVLSNIPEGRLIVRDCVKDAEGKELIRLRFEDNIRPDCYINMMLDMDEIMNAFMEMEEQERINKGITDDSDNDSEAEHQVVGEQPDAKRLKTEEE